MTRLLSRFVLVLSAIVALGYAYVTWRLALPSWACWALAVPFGLVWLVPMSTGRENARARPLPTTGCTPRATWCMGWLNFLVLAVALRDALLGATWALGVGTLHAALVGAGTTAVLVGSLAALAAGALFASRGPQVRQVRIPIDGLALAFEGFRIVQISDLHVGPTIGERYVRRVVEMSNALEADLVVLTGDIVDGSTQRLARHVAPLADLKAAHGVVFVLGNHDCYSGARAWSAHFRALGMQVLLNEHLTLERSGKRMVIGGVVDPALRATEPKQAPMRGYRRPNVREAPAFPPSGVRRRGRHDSNPRVGGIAQAAAFVPRQPVVAPPRRQVLAPACQSHQKRARVCTGCWRDLRRASEHEAQAAREKPLGFGCPPTLQPHTGKAVAARRCAACTWRTPGLA